MDALSLYVPYIIIWVVFRMWWVLAGRNAKQKTSAPVAVPGETLRQMMMFALILLLFLGFFTTDSSIIRDPVIRVASIILMLAGLGFAAWAKVHMGANWDMPMKKVTGGGLVTTGPYRYIRHPIYTGILLAMVGTALATNWHVLVIALVSGINFVYFAHVEETSLAQRFPKDYPAYQARSKKFIPFVW